VILGLAAVFLALAFLGAVVMRVVDQQDFQSLGTAVWWALQTVTTVGYGDVVPTTAAGRVVGGILMVLGVSFIAFVTAGVTSIVVKRGGREEAEAERDQRERSTRVIVEGLAQTTEAITALEQRLRQIESRLAS
jgi:voltage-gated potassium channel